MDIADTCLACSKPNCQECRGQLVRFFQLLQTAADREINVSRGNVTSTQSLHPQVMGAGIDKLHGFFRTPLPVVEAKHFVMQSHCVVEEMVLDRRKCLAIRDDRGTIHLTINRHHEIGGFMTNPNRFGSWRHFISHFNSIVPDEQIHSAQITRLDLNIDFELSFAEAIQKIDFSFKNKSVSYDDESGTRTGMTIGKGTEYMVMYDRAKREKVDSAWTRLELRMFKAKLPTRMIAEVPKAILQRSFFDKVMGLNAHVNESTKTLNEGASLKLIEFNHILRRDGYFAAKKYFNHMGNFQRDFAKLIEVNHWSIQPQDIFHKHIQKFFQ